LNSSDKSADVWIVYDGECPVCRSFVTLYRLRALNATIHLIDARTRDALPQDLNRHAVDLDNGMLVKANGRVFYGADAMHILAVLGARGTVFNRMNRAIFRHPRIARLLYPPLVFGRKLLLRILGRRLIAEA
jgi:predicted DCC family thiol-disulfide oxidoreductase YuxK